MIEKFEERTLTGTINIKMDDAKGRWVGDKSVIVRAIVDISREYYNAGYTLTLRQLYYQLVSRDVIPNHDKVYAKISSIKDDCVYSGEVDWECFEDRGRVPKIAYFEDNVADSLTRTLASYRLDRQIGQKNHIEVWTEKDAISSILSRVTNPYTVRLVVNKGYTSSTAIYGAYKRFAESMNAGNPVKVLYFGDHDPSGLDMIRDIRDRLMFMFTKGEEFAYNYGGSTNNVFDRMLVWWENEGYNIYDCIEEYPQYSAMEKIIRTNYDGGSDDRLEDMWDTARLHFYIDKNALFEVIPVGLTMAQIQQYNPPPNPAKITDPRAKKYVEEFGQVSWEVDALTPKIMTEIVEKAVTENMDMGVYNSLMVDEKKDKKLLSELIDKANGTS